MNVLSLKSRIIRFLKQKNVSDTILSFWLSIGLLFLSPLVLSADDTILLKNARIYTMGKNGDLEKGMILINGLKIEKVGVTIQVPSGTKIFDLTGKTIIPGLVCASSSLFLSETERTFQGDEKPDTNILDGINLYDEKVPVVLRNGVTAAFISPVSFKTVGGLGAVVKLTAEPGQTPEILKQKAALRLRMESLSQEKTSNLLRLTQYHAVRDKFVAASHYREEWEKYEKKLNEYKEAQKDKTKTKKVKKPKEPRKDPGNDILIEVMDQKIPLWIEVHSPDAILNSLRIAEEFSCRLILESIEGWPTVISQIQQSKASFLISPLSDWPKFTLPGGPQGYIARMLNINPGSFLYSDQESTIKTSAKATPQNWQTLIAGDSRVACIPPDIFPLSARNLREYAALLIAEGINRSDALKSITIAPAKILGVANRVGSIEEGKDADLVILNGAPLNTLSRIEKVLVNGAIVWEGNNE